MILPAPRFTAKPRKWYWPKWATPFSISRLRTVPSFIRSLERRYGPWFCFGRPLLPFVLYVLVWVHDSQTDVSDWSGVLVAAVLALTLKLTQGDRLGRHLVYLLNAAALTSIRTCGRIYSPGCWKACCPLLGGQRVLGLQAPHCKKSFFANHLSVATIWTGRAEFGQKAWRDEGWGTFPLCRFFLTFGITESWLWQWFSGFRS